VRTVDDGIEPHAMVIAGTGARVTSSEGSDRSAVAQSAIFALAPRLQGRAALGQHAERCLTIRRGLVHR
jgi:hypothetical protein